MPKISLMAIIVLAVAVPIGAPAAPAKARVRSARLAPTNRPQSAAKVIADQAAEIRRLKQQLAELEHAPSIPPTETTRIVEDYNAALRRAAADDSDASEAITTLKQYQAWPPPVANGYRERPPIVTDPDSGQQIDTTDIYNRIWYDYDDEKRALVDAAKLYPLLHQAPGFVQYYVETERWQPSDYFDLYDVNDMPRPKDPGDLHYVERRNGVNGIVDKAATSPETTAERAITPPQGANAPTGPTAAETTGKSRPGLDRAGK